jgi:hypothetical protein
MGLTQGRSFSLKNSSDPIPRKFKNMLLNIVDIFVCPVYDILGQKKLVRSKTSLFSTTTTSSVGLLITCMLECAPPHLSGEEWAGLSRLGCLWYHTATALRHLLTYYLLKN